MPAAPSGLQRIVQQDFSGGMFPQLAPELIPANGAFDIENGLLNEQDVCYRRGGTSYLSTVDAGAPVRMLWSGYLKHGGLQTILATSSAVYRVETNGSLTPLALDPPAAVTVPTVFQGRIYLPGEGSKHVWNGETATGDSRPDASPFYATAGSRLLVGSGRRVSVGNIPTVEGEAPGWTEATNFLELPGGVQITGMAGWRDKCAVFTTQGIWLIGGLSHSGITDEAGNVQWTQDRYSADAALWGQPGVAAWKGGLVVPCRDDVWLMQLGVSSERSVPFQAITGPIRNLYRRYVAAGYQPGAAVVFNGHYFLPVMKGNEPIDLLVCRLEGAGRKDAPAWTHFSGWGARLAALTSTASDIEGALLGATAGVARVLTLGYFTPGSALANDANGDPVSFSLTTRSTATGPLTANLVAKLRLSYRLAAGPETRVRVGFGTTAYGAEWDEFNWDEANWSGTTGPLADLGDATPVASADPEALTPRVWHPRRKVRFARMRISLEGAASEFSIRALELFVRQDGRQI